MEMKRLTKEQAVVISAYTGYLMVPFAEMHADIERRLGHPVFTASLASKETRKTVMSLYRNDFIDLCIEDESNST